MDISVTKDILLSAGVLGIGSKILWDWLKGGSVGSSSKPSGDTEKILIGSNGKLQSNNLIKVLENNRCSAHDHLASGVTEMIVLQKSAVQMQEENSRRLGELKEDLKTMRMDFRSDFDEAFSRIRGVENRVGCAEGDIKAIRAVTSTRGQ